MILVVRSSADLPVGVAPGFPLRRQGR